MIKFPRGKKTIMLQKSRSVSKNDYLIAFSEVENHEVAVARGLLSLGANISVVFSEREDELRVSARADMRTIKKKEMNLGQGIFSKLKEISGGMWRS